MQIGDLVARYPYGCQQAHTGKVIFIHPDRRFYVCEFECGLGRSFRQAFYFKDRNASAEVVARATATYRRKRKKRG